MIETKFMFYPFLNKFTRCIAVFSTAFVLSACHSSNEPRNDTVVEEPVIEDQPIVQEAPFFSVSLLEKEGQEAFVSEGVPVVPEGLDGGMVARFSLPQENDPSKKRFVASFPLDVDALRGAKVSLSAFVKAKGVKSSVEGQVLPGYQGVKLQLLVISESRDRVYIDTRYVHGTFDWKTIRVMADVPLDAQSVTLNVGLEGCVGTAWFQDVCVDVVSKTSPRIRTPEAEAQALSAQTTMRGVMSPHRYRTEDFDQLKEWGVNAVRWQMYQPKSDTRSWDEWIAAELDELSLALDAAAERNMRLVIDLHTAPGKRLPDRSNRMFFEQEYADRFQEIWLEIVERFKGHPGVWAYDLINEPVQVRPSPDGIDNWLELQTRVAKAIRQIDPDTPIMIETDNWCSPESYANLKPIDVPGVIYQAHMYWPGSYTHQGVRTNQGVADGQMTGYEPIQYPGKIGTTVINKEALRKYLETVRQFQLDTGAPIYIGEFSVVRWAPGGAQYLEDCISIFEEYGWDWTYHAYREWEGWSVEHENLPANRTQHQLASKPTDRLQVLLNAFERNNSEQMAEDSL